MKIKSTIFEKTNYNVNFFNVIYLGSIITETRGDKRLTVEVIVRNELVNPFVRIVSNLTVKWCLIV